MSERRDFSESEKSRRLFFHPQHTPHPSPTRYTTTERRSFSACQPARLASSWCILSLAAGSSSAAAFHNGATTKSRKPSCSFATSSSVSRCLRCCATCVWASHKKRLFRVRVWLAGSQAVPSLSPWHHMGGSTCATGARHRHPCRDLARHLVAELGAHKARPAPRQRPL